MLSRLAWLNAKSDPEIGRVNEPLARMKNVCVTFSARELSTLKTGASIVDWSSVNVVFQGGNVEKNVVSLSDVCQNSSASTSKEISLFPTQVTFTTASEICRQGPILLNH